MSVSSLSELKLFLEATGTKPKKSLSQNFLIDQNILQKIVKYADVKAGDSVLEIGAGPGALTETLLKCHAKITAVEKDLIFAENLRRFDGVEVFAGDIREFPLDRMKGKAKAKVVANLPYHLTSPILDLIVPRNDLFSSLTLMVQEEVARRMTAKVGEKDYSLLTLFLHFYADVEYNFLVSKRCFYPIPQVESAVVTLRLKQPLHSFDSKGFFSLLKKAFQQRRKMLRSSLKGVYPQELLEQALHSIGKSIEDRPETLSLQHWIEVYLFILKAA